MQQTKDGKLISEIITENDKTTERVYKDDETIQELITQGDNKKATIYNSENKRLEQCVIKDGEQYTLEYDGKGNTKGIIVQNGESISALAKKFHCSEQDIIELNKDILNGKKYFNVGDEIKLPRELDADDKALQGRKNSEEAILEYEQEQAQKAAARAKKQAELKALGVVSTEGAGEKRIGYTGQENLGTRKKSNLTYTVVGKTGVRGREIVKGSNGKYYTMAADGTILKEEYAKATSLYDSGTKIKGTLKEKQKDGSLKEVSRDFAIVGELGKGRKAVVDKNGKSYVMSHDGKILDSNYLQRDEKADEISKDPKKAQKETISLMGSQVANAEAAFNQQLAEDGWAGDVADGISILWGSKNRASVVREELAKYKSDMAELQKYSDSGDDTKFKAKFKEMYGVEYNQNAVAAYTRFPTTANYRKAFGTTNDIGLRVAKYNESQQKGASAVKTGVVIAASTAAAIATGGTSLVATAAIAGASTMAARAAVEVTDLATNDIEGDINGENLDNIAEQAMTEGALAAVTVGIAKGTGNVLGKTAAKAAPKTTGGTPAPVPKSPTGQSGLVRVKSTNTGNSGNTGNTGRTGSTNNSGNTANTGAAGTSAQNLNIAKDISSKISASGGLNNLSQAEKTKLAEMLGITPEKLTNLSKADYKKLILKFHPDRYTGNAEFATLMIKILNHLKV